MCTLIALHRCVAATPLVVAANRDEFLDRPAKGPALREGVSGPVVAPLDERAGGSWLGVNARGLFVGITNRPVAAPDTTRRSRGLLVMDTLAAGDAEEAGDRLAALPAGAYNPFNLFVSDGEQAFAVVYQEKPQLERLGPGAHVIGNADPDAREVPKIGRLLARAEAAAELPADEVLPALAAICRAHEGGPPREDACMHLTGYGTRSSTLLWFGDGGARMWWADGPPCRAPYEDVSFLLRELGRPTLPLAAQPATRTIP
jgi:uncharacterized protein with NRDE domain